MEDEEERQSQLQTKQNFTNEAMKIFIENTEEDAKSSSDDSAMDYLSVSGCSAKSRKIDHSIVIERLEEEEKRPPGY